MILQVFAGNPGKRGITESLITLLATISWIHVCFKHPQGWVDEHLRIAGDFLTLPNLWSLGKLLTTETWPQGQVAHLPTCLWCTLLGTKSSPPDSFGRWILVKPWVGCHLNFLGVYPSNLKHPSVVWGNPFGRWVKLISTKIDGAPSCGNKKTQSMGLHFLKPT